MWELLRRLTSTFCSFLPAADVGLLIQHMIDGAHVDDVGRRDLVLKLPGQMTQPDINSFFEGELGFTRIVVLYDWFRQDSLLMWLGETRKRLPPLKGPQKAERALRKVCSAFPCLV